MLRALNKYYQQWKQTDPSNINNWSDLGLSFHDSVQYCTTFRDNWVICLNINDNAKSLLVSVTMHDKEIVLLMCIERSGQYKYYHANKELNKFYQLDNKPMCLKPFKQYSEKCATSETSIAT